MIAAIANTLLNAKENSPQTIGQSTKSWVPYRIVGQGAYGEVTTRNLINDIFSGIEQEKKKSVTVIAFKNIELLKFALNLMVQQSLENGHGSGQDNIDIGGDNERSQIKYKIALNGKGESSGRQKWVKQKKMLADFFNIFTGRSSKLKYRPWSDVEEAITWVRVCSDLVTFELNEYSTLVDLIQEYQSETLTEYRKFEESVVDTNYSAEEADIILTTVHAAKGILSLKVF